METPQQADQFKAKQKAVWAAGSYDDIASFIPPVAHHLVQQAGVREGERVLDVATGTGVTAITARMQGADVTGVDLTPELLDRARRHERLAGVQGIEWHEGDAERMPFPDASFDVVISSFGHLFAPRPDVTTSEMLRVLTRGGRIAAVTHKKGAAAQAMFAAAAKHVPPPADGPPSPFEWGDRDVVRDRLGPDVTDIRFEEGNLVYPALSPAHYWELFSAKFGPVVKTLEALGSDEQKKTAFRQDFIKAITPFWSMGEVKIEYLLTCARKK